MQIHELKISRRKPRKRIGRGGKRGTYSGRGMKGQKSRSGAHINPLFEGGRSSLIERLKKVKGFKSIHKKLVIVKFSSLSRKFENGAKITPEELVKNNLIEKKDLKRGVKILGPKDGKKTFSFDEKIKISKSVM
jgi:large subunit ribosomal protein L15